MNTKSAAQAYKSSSIENAPPVKIVRLLYEGALRFLERAEQSQPAATHPEYTRNIARAEAIVAELRASLDHGPAPDVARELDRLYEYVQHCLSRATLERDARATGEARKVLTTLLAGWKALEIEAGEAAA